VIRAAETVNADSLPGELRKANDDHRIGLERYRHGGGSPARAAACGAGVDGGVVAGRAARGWMRVAASGEGKEAGTARARLQSRDGSNGAGRGSRERRRIH